MRLVTVSSAGASGSRTSQVTWDVEKFSRTRAATHAVARARYPVIRRSSRRHAGQTQLPTAAYVQPLWSGTPPIDARPVSG